MKRKIDRIKEKRKNKFIKRFPHKHYDLVLKEFKKGKVLSNIDYKLLRGMKIRGEEIDKDLRNHCDERDETFRASFNKLSEAVKRTQQEVDRVAQNLRRNGL